MIATADVVLNTTIKGRQSPVLSYRVPAHLRPFVAPGQLVWAPLQRRRIQGLVLALRESDDREHLRDLIDMADPAARIPPNGLRLGQWIAETYHAPLYEALALLLPPGVSQVSEPTWRATSYGMNTELGQLPVRERAVLYLLRRRGEMAERELRGELRGSDSELRSTYAALAERGMLTRGTSISAARARPRRERFARLLLAPGTAGPALNNLERAPRQYKILDWLIQHSFTPENETAPLLPVREIQAATGATAALLRTLEQRDLIRLEEREVRRDPLAGDGVPPDQPPPLTSEQERAWRAIAAALETATGTAEAPAPLPFLLHGVTGSGKTEVYLRAIARAMRLGRQALVLVPEIALTVQLVRRFAARFPGRLAVLHSGLALGERYDEWRRLQRGEARLAIGSRSVVFAPLPELGLVIVDEEHEPTYKHEGSPRYHARDAAIELAAISGSVLILGSATPAVESFYAAEQGRYTLLEMRERVGGGLGPDGLPRSQVLPLPPVRLVDMRNELRSGNRSMFSRPLQAGLAEVLERGEQAILFLNRRGAASFVMCRDCGQVVNCPACNAPLTLHYEDPPDADPEERSLLICHSCNYRQLVPAACPACLSPRIREFGVGTQRVEEEVQRLFPEARPLRWDRDSVGGKGGHARMLETFLRHEADVLIGTQMIAKGLDLPLVSLVGVVAADIGLHLPDFRSGERSFQLLTQVAGRAGRRQAGSRVFIQTYNPEHYALRAAAEHSYQEFYSQELAFRRQTGYPPLGRLLRFVYASGSLASCEREARGLAERLGEQLQRRGLSDWSIIGPAPAFWSRQRGRWRWHMFLRMPAGVDSNSINRLIDALEPLRGWTLDLDPLQVL